MGMGGGMEKGGGGGTELPQWLGDMLIPGIRQGLIIINDPKDAEMVVQFFTGMIINKDPYKIIDWRREYVSVSGEEFQEELKLLTMPLLVEQPIGRAINTETGRSFVVVMRKVFILLLAPPIDFVIFGQPSTALLVSDADKAYLGFKGIDPNTGNRITVTVKSTIANHVTIPFVPAVARYIFVRDVVEAIIDSDGKVQGMRR
jgi:hypothetical protein